MNSDILHKNYKVLEYAACYLVCFAFYIMYTCNIVINLMHFHV